MKNGIPSDFPVDVDRFLMSETVGCMDNEQLGAYWRLLLYAWTQVDCTIPADDDRLAKLSRMGKRWAKAGAIVRKCFEPVPGNPERLLNKLQVQTREEQRARMEKSAEKCEKMRQAKANKQDNQMKFEDLPKAPSKAIGEASCKEAAKGAVEVSYKESLVEPLKALSSSYSDSLPIPKGGGSHSEIVNPKSEIASPPLPSVGKGGSDGPFRPVPGHDPIFAMGALPGTVKTKVADIEAVKRRILADDRNVRIELMESARDMIEEHRRLARSGWEQRIEQIEKNPAYRRRVPLPEVADIIGLWDQRIADLRLASSGAKVAA